MYLLRITEARQLKQSHDLPHNKQMITDKSRRSMSVVCHRSNPLGGRRCTCLQQESVLQNITKKLIRSFWDKHSFVVFNNESSYNDVLIVDWSTIAVNKYKQVYLEITQRRHILITHRIYIYCKRNRRFTIAPSRSNRLHEKYLTLPGKLYKWYQWLQYWISHVQVQINL